ncbi:transposase [Paramuricea clavata]|uniref:Transposase n=1 Tax=Paramuricea clavata TaxID=317549 RepID=A0A7D9E7L7_PARCT|nr:transposase [Paramuricea clavata]
MSSNKSDSVNSSESSKNIEPAGPSEPESTVSGEESEDLQDQEGSQSAAVQDFNAGKEESPWPKLNKFFHRVHPDKLYEFNELTTTRALKKSVDANTDQPHGYNKQPKQLKQGTLSWSKGSVKRPLLSKENLGRLTLNMVIESLLPMSFVEQPSFKELITINKGLEKGQEASMAVVKDAMAKVEWIATTIDCWSAHRRSYLGVTAHWLSADSFNRESSALACQRIMGSHTYDRIAAHLKTVHSDYGINSKVVKTTSDNGSNFIKAFAVFAPSEDKLDVSVTDMNDIFSDQDESLELPSHQKCAAAYSLNLVSTTTAAAAAAAEKDYQYKKLSRASFAKCQALWDNTGRAVQAKEIIDEESLLQIKRPCSTRWNSVFDAVQRLNKINKVGVAGPQTLNNICQRLDLPRLKDTELEFLNLYEAVMRPIATALDVLQGLECIRNRLAADNVVESEETEAKEDEVSANKFFKAKKKSSKDVLELYLSSDNDDFDIFKELCASLRKLALELNTPLPARAACERLFSTGELGQDVDIIPYDEDGIPPSVLEERSDSRIPLNQ